MMTDVGLIASQPIDFGAIFDAAPSPYLLLLPDRPRYTIAAVNDAYLLATGTERAEIVGRGLFEVFPDNPDDHSASGVSDLRSSLDRVLRDNAPDAMGMQKYDIPLHDGSGRFAAKYWSPVNTPVPGPDGKIGHIIHRVEDITDFVLARERDQAESAKQIESVQARAERMEAEILRGGAELKAANRQLKQASEQLAEANEKLKQADRAKTEFFSNISHEFRTPLTLLLGPLEELLAPSERTRADERVLLETAHRGALRLTKLVNALLDFSRIEAGKAQVSYEPTDLATLTAELASNFHSACAEAGLSLTIDCPPLAEPVPVDREMWEKIVLNLISNAFKFTLKGGIAISLHANGDLVELVVSDSGVGIDAAELPRIFERFHRVQGQRGRSHEGSGIGLALVSEMVGLHGGTIFAESEVGKGSSFTVSIPRSADRAAPMDGADGAALHPDGKRAKAYVAEAERWLPEPATRVASPVAEQGGILLVDDNADMRNYVKRILEDAGYDVHAVADGAAALAAARKEPTPDLILSDVMMPGPIDGFGLLRELRSSPRTETVPIVLLSARAGEEARIEGLAAGADEYVVKPFGARELLARIDSAIRLARTRRQAALHENELEAIRAEAKLRLAMDAAKMGEVIYDLRDDRVIHTPGFALLLGCEAERRLSLGDIRDRCHPDDRAMVHIHTATAFAGDAEYFEIEHRVVWPDGTAHWLAGRFQIGRDATGEAIEAIAVYMDITERKWVEERQRLLLDELNHRVKNTLSTVQSIAVQTRRGAPTPELFGEMFEARIAALAGAHDLLTQGSWEGASLADVVGRTLAPYVSAADDRLPRIVMGGPMVRLSPNAAVTLNMAFHELATNAAKYGSLSTAAGRLDIFWAIDDSVTPAVVELIWNERGGPPVTPPDRRGFGSRLVEQGLARELDGEVSLRYEPQGLRGTIRLPASQKVSLP